MTKTSSAMDMRKELLAKKQALLGTEKPVYKTNGMFRPYSDSERFQFDIRTATQSQIVNGYKSLLSHKQACEDLGITDKHIGFPVEDWVDDMKLRLAVINRSATLKKIDVLENKLRSVLTPKELREIGIEDLAQEMKDL